MNILFLTWNFPPTIGGIEYVTGNLYEQLLRRGHRVEKISKHDLKLLTRFKLFNRNKFLLLCFQFKCCIKFLRLAFGAKPDVVLCGSVVSAPAAYLMKVFLGIPYGVLVHGSEVLYGNPLFKQGVRFLLNNASRLACNSNQTKSLVEDLGIAKDKVVTVYPGVDPQPFLNKNQEVLERYAQQFGDKRLLLFVGRLVKRKGVLEFIQKVMPELTRRMEKTHLAIVGDNPHDSLVHRDDLHKQILEAIREQHLEEKVTFLGAVGQEDLVALYFLAELLVLPCVWYPHDVEGFGVVFLEAAMAETPSLGTRLGGIPEAIVAGETGIIVAPGDYKAMTEALEKLLSDPESRDKLGKQAFKRANEEFTWERISQRYEDHLLRMVAVKNEAL